MPQGIITENPKVIKTGSSKATKEITPPGQSQLFPELPKLENLALLTKKSEIDGLKGAKKLISKGEEYIQASILSRVFFNNTPHLIYKLSKQCPELDAIFRRPQSQPMWADKLTKAPKFFSDEAHHSNFDKYIGQFLYKCFLKHEKAKQASTKAAQDLLAAAIQHGVRPPKLQECEQELVAAAIAAR